MGYYDSWQFPVAESAVICDSTSATLSIAGTGVFTWYDSTMTNILAVADTFQTPILQETTSYFVIASDSLCTSSPVEVTVSIDSTSFLPVIIIDPVYCEGQNVILSSNNSGDFLWTLPDFSTITSSQLIISDVSMADVGTYSLQTYNSNCISEPVSAELLVEPMATVEILYTDSVICQDSLLLVATGDFSSIQWVVDEQVIQGGDSLWISSAGEYIAYVDNGNSYCGASDQVFITNTSNVMAPEVFDQSACAGQSLAIFLGLANPFWATDPQLSDIQFTNTIPTGVLTQNVIYYVGQIDDGGCYSETSILSVDVTTSPAPNVYYNDPVCEGETLTLNTDVPDALIEWTLPDNSTTIQQPLIIENSDLTNQGQYSAIAINNDCITEAANIEVIIHPMPASPVIVGDLEYCFGDELTLFYQDFQDSLSTWLVEEVLVNDSIFYLPSVSGSFTIEAYFFDGICSSQTSVDIVLNPNPVVDNIYTNSPVCVGDELTLSTSENVDYSYVWTGPLNFVDSTSQTVVSTVSTTQSGEYVVQVSNEYGCHFESSIEAQVLSYPNIDLGSDTIICPGVPILLTIDNIYDSYQWSTGDFSNELLVEEGGIYSVEVANGPCWISDEIEIIEDCNLVFAPNIITPNGDLLNDKLFFVSPMIKTLNVYVYNRWGNLVGEWHDIDGYWDGTHYLTGEDLAEGSYYYVLDYIDIKGEHHHVKSYITLIR